tara:strand:- start:1059 stop:1685 length:627 start_codon:yes stop_codon:yes gene_type:complete
MQDQYFDGRLDDARMVDYQKMAFGGGFMISKVVPSTNQVTIYNSNSEALSMKGLELYTGTDTKCASLPNSNLASESTHTITCTLNDDDAVRLHDHNPTNPGSGGGEGDGDEYEYIIDGVCWNDDGGNSGTIDADCGSGDAMILAGVWTANTAIDGTDSSEIYQLKNNGNNDQAVSDWEAIPEFGTLLMPIASVLLIVGYNYRRKETEA